MRYLLREKLLAVGDDFTIKDETGREVFFVDGKVFTLRDELEIKDMQGHQVAVIKRKMVSVRPSYEIWQGGQRLAVVSRSLIRIFRDKFQVDVPGPDDLEVQGDFFSREYTFRRGGQVVAQVSRRWFSITDSYGVDIGEGENDVLILACAIVIDRISFEENERDMGPHR